MDLPRQVCPILIGNSITRDLTELALRNAKPDANRQPMPAVPRVTARNLFAFFPSNARDLSYESHSDIVSIEFHVELAIWPSCTIPPFHPFGSTWNRAGYTSGKVGHSSGLITSPLSSLG